MTDDPNHVQYQSGPLTASSIRSATTCFKYDDTKSVSVQIFNAGTTLSVGSIQSIPIHNVSLSTITLTDPAFTASFAIWISKHQCLEVQSGHMFIQDVFTINVHFYRMKDSQSTDPVQYNRISSSTTNLRLSKSNTASWSTMVCLPGSPVTPHIEYAAADITVTSYWTQYEYTVMYINHQPTPSNRFISAPYSNYQGAHRMPISAHFAVGDVTFKYWQSCNISCNDKFGPCWDDQQHKVLQQQFPLYVFLVLGGIVMLTLLMVIAAYFNTRHTHQLASGEVDYKVFLWLMIELWNWWTDLSFVLYLYMNVTLITEERVPGLVLLFALAVMSLLLTFIINMVYLVHYLQMWSERHAPGITRLWLQEWSWFLISMSMTFGGVHVALEFCNSLITPNLNIFTMHVPHSEMVRTRKDRFITNVFCENIPFIVIYILYTLEIKQFESQQPQSNVIVYIGVITTALSVVLSTMWAVYRRGYAQVHPLALYSVQIHFKTERWKQYYIHCHNRICRAVQNGLKVRKTNLIILDQCSESFESMKIEARILKDTKVFGYELPPVSNATAQQILNCLISEFRQTQNSLEGPGNMELKNFYAEHVNYGRGEYVYNHNTGVLVLCNGIKSCFCPHKHKKSKRNSKIPQTTQMTQKAMQMADWNDNKNNNGALYPAQMQKQHHNNAYDPYQSVLSASIASPCALNDDGSAQAFKFPNGASHQF